MKKASYSTSGGVNVKQRGKNKSANVKRTVKVNGKEVDPNKKEPGFTIEEIVAIGIIFRKADPCDMLMESPSIKAKCDAIIASVQAKQKEKAGEKRG